MKRSFDLSALEHQYAFLDDCPESLIQDVITVPIGTLQERVRGVRKWYDALLDGCLPCDGGWPPLEVSGPIRSALEQLGMLRFLKGQISLVEALMKDILRAIGRRNDFVLAEIEKHLQESEAIEKARLDEDEANIADVEARRAYRSDRPNLKIKRISGSVGQEFPRGPCGQYILVDAEGEDGNDHIVGEPLLLEEEPDSELIEIWEARARAWKDIHDVFGDLGAMIGCGWGLAEGVLRHTGWCDLLRLRELVEKLPQLQEIIRALGRLQIDDQNESVADQIFLPVRRLEEERHEIWTEFVPAETRGIERSGEVGRMLPGEAMLLGHPRLRYLWHARRTERAMLTYRVEGVEIDTIWVEHESEEATDGTRPRKARGPIIAVIDTSGSMAGLPEQVAKALVLEALRTAHSENRRCYVYSFGAPKEVIEHELALSPDGVGRLLTFLGASFGGGTDPGAAIRSIVAKIKEGEWSKADVLIASDGEWHVASDIIDGVREAREAGTRFHGIQIAKDRQTSLHSLCDPVHMFQNWAPHAFPARAR